MAVVLALAAPGAQAWAQAKAEGGQDAAQQADALFAEGKRLRRAGRKIEARAKYAAALALKKSYDVAGNLGSLELELGMYRDAAEHLSFALRTYASTGSTQEQLAKARQLLAEAKQRVSTVRVAVNVAGAEVLVDGKSIGHAPLGEEVFVEPGARVFEARLAGYGSARQTLEAVKGGTQNVALALAPAAQAVAPVSSSGAARPGTAAGPAVKAEPAAPVTPAASANAKENGASSPGVPPLVIGGLVGAGTLAIAGVAFVLASNANASDAEEQRAVIVQKGNATCLTTTPAPECEAIKSSLEGKSTFGNLAIWSFVLGGALGASTLIYSLAAPGPKRTTAVDVIPVVATQSGGVVIAGRW